MIYNLMNPAPNLGASLTITADGVTDDITNIELIINHVSNQGGGTVIFPSGKTIAISRPIIAKSNVNLLTTGGKTTLKLISGDVETITTLLSISGNTTTYRNNIIIDGFIFSKNQSEDTLNQGIYVRYAENITIRNCCFENISTNINSLGILIQDSKDTHIDSCIFKNTTGGIKYQFENSGIRITNNTFEFLTGHGIHILGEKQINEDKFSSKIWITGNKITIGSEGVHGIYLTCGNTEFESNTRHHENVVVANNVITGPGGLSNASGGTADLFSLKDIIRLKCYGNTARNSGDLGFAIERCYDGSVTNNTADQNNSCGISIFGSSNMSVVGNVCGNNEQDHDGTLNHPYGGIRVEFDSVHIILSGNHFYGERIPNDPNQQQYGIVVRPATVTEITDVNEQTRTPYNIKIGVNHYVDHLLGDIYDQGTGTIIEDSNATVVTVAQNP